MMAFPRSIRVRLTLWYVVILAVILAAFSAGIYLTLRHNLSSNLNDSLENRADVLAGIVEYQNGRPTLQGVLSPAGLEADDQFVRVYDSSAAVTFDSAAGADATPLDAGDVQKALAGQASHASAKVRKDPMRVLVVPVRDGGRVAGALEVGMSEDDIRDTLRTLLLILGVAYPVTLGVASVGGLFLAGRALSPIDRITRLARRISAEDLSQRLNADLPPDEVGRLARTFDDMIARLDAAFRRQRQFTADASHELRTPLTAIKGQIEVTLSREREGSDYRQVLGGVNEEVDRLTRLIASLLTLARADAGEIPIARDRVDVPALVSSAVEQVRPAAEQKGLALQVEAGPDAMLQADHDLLLQLVLNLLDNALKYTDRGGRVSIGWNRNSGALRLWVRDTGAGIAPEHVERVFDRFYRVDKARSRAEGGAGLGLSISRWIAEAHGGKLRIESETGRGTTVELRIDRVDGTRG